MTEQITAEDHISEMQTYVLRRITRAVKDLDLALREAESAATRARQALRDGNRVSGMGFSHGPLGHQTPFDIAKSTNTLHHLIEQAQMLGCTDEQIAAAYKLED